MAWTLCSKTDITDIHPIPQSELKDSWSEMVEGMIRLHMGEPYLGSTQAITDEYHDGDGTRLLWVRKPPIVSVESISVAGASLTAADYVVFQNFVQLKDRYFTAGNLNVTISYTSGAPVVDDNIRLCAAAMIVAIINYRKRQGADASLKWGSGLDMKAGEETPNTNVGLTSHLSRIMKQTLKRRRARVR